MGMRTVSRRDFLRIGGAGVGMVFIGRVGGELFQVPVAAAQIPGGSLDPTTVPKYVTAMLIPPVMPRAAHHHGAGWEAGRLLRDLDEAVLASRSCRRGICRPASRPRRCGATARSAAQSNRGLLLHHAPSLTIEAQYNRPVRVKWINELVDANGSFPAPPAAGGPDPALGEPARWHDGRDIATGVRLDPRARTRGRCPSSPTPTAPWASATRATATPRRGTCRPPTTSPPASPPRAPGTTSSPAKAAAGFGATWGPGFAAFQYPNLGRAATTWYHDHALGMTRLNVYAGPAGFFIIRGGPARRRRRARQPHRTHGVAARAGAPRGRQVPAEQALPGDPHRHPGPIVQRRRVAVLSRHPSLLRRHHRPVHPRHRHLADLEPRVLRQHDHGQREHLAVPDRSSSAATGSGSSTAASRGSSSSTSAASPASRCGRSATRAASWPRR